MTENMAKCNYKIQKKSCTYDVSGIFMSHFIYVQTLYVMLYKYLLDAFVRL